MKKNIILFGCLLGLIITTAVAWEPITDPAVYMTITRVTTSETRVLDFLPLIDEGWDYGDTTNTITENYGGNPFIYGGPVQIEVFVTHPPTNDMWETLVLEYVTGTNSGAVTNWTEIGTIEPNRINSITNVAGCHFGITWRPPAATNYLVRMYGVTTNLMENAERDAINITSKGDGLTWDNSEVVGFTITENTRPGVL